MKPPIKNVIQSPVRSPFLRVNKHRFEPLPVDYPFQSNIVFWTKSTDVNYYDLNSDNTVNKLTARYSDFNIVDFVPPDSDTKPLYESNVIGSDGMLSVSPTTGYLQNTNLRNVNLYRFSNLCMYIRGTGGSSYPALFAFNDPSAPGQLSSYFANNGNHATEGLSNINQQQSLHLPNFFNIGEVDIVVTTFDGLTLKVYRNGVLFSQQNYMHYIYTPSTHYYLGFLGLASNVGRTVAKLANNVMLDTNISDSQAMAWSNWHINDYYASPSIPNDDIAGLYIADSNNVTLDQNGYVSSWHNSHAAGGLGNLNQAQGGGNPLFSAIGFNGRPTLVFNGTSNFLETTITNLDLTEFSVFAIMQQVGAGTNYGAVVMLLSGTTGTQWWLGQTTAASHTTGRFSVYDTAQTPEEQVFDQANYWDNSTSFYSATYGGNGTARKLYKNGSLITTSSNVNITRKTGSHLRVGKSTAGNMAMNLSVLAIIKREATTKLIYDMNTYSRLKWGT